MGREIKSASLHSAYAKKLTRASLKAFSDFARIAEVFSWLLHRFKKEHSFIPLWTCQVVYSPATSHNLFIYNFSNTISSGIKSWRCLIVTSYNTWWLEEVGFQCGSVPLISGVVRISGKHPSPVMCSVLQRRKWQTKYRKPVLISTWHNYGACTRSKTLCQHHGVCQDEDSGHLALQEFVIWREGCLCKQ